MNGYSFKNPILPFRDVILMHALGECPEAIEAFIHAFSPVNGRLEVHWQ